MKGHFCWVYKRCKICNEIKHFTEFASKGGGYGKRKTYCKNCRGRKKETILSPGLIYSYNSNFLSKTEQIEISGRTSNGTKYRMPIDLELASVLVNEGNAGIVHPTLIHNFFDKESFKREILLRDNYVCHFCGEYGDTIDHIVPKAKGGRRTIKNCVCACNNCNQAKGDLPYKVFLSTIKGSTSVAEPGVK
ncbi:MAG TPA: HNH endonuclease [Bacillus sp. (in: firmicutes)]|uniref:HNH endonuclease n=1 Tax=Bacillus litorisediminis TaxID=2922713 RepID=UPI001FAF9344|nr:HNH endonuclease [Bacillus litorisediminis]HWO78641.1 HNH endonuclease [Bacillus sp. (in: firmicutes)]